jgi:phage terminase small subunit
MPVVEIPPHSSESYIRAGLAPVGTPREDILDAATRLARRNKVVARVRELREQSAARTTVTAARVLEEMAKIGFANMMDYIQIQPDGSAYVDLNQVDRDKAAAISEIVVDTYMDGKGDDAREVKRVRLKLHDKRGALMDMGKHLGMFTQRVEHTGPGGGPIQTANSVEVSLLDRDEREMLKQLLLLAAERKRGKEIGLDPKQIAADYEELK